MVMTVPPVETRPRRRASEPGGDERILDTTAGRRIVLRQIGWHGQSGAFYALDEDPARHERGSFAPLWLVVDEEQPGELPA